MSKVTEGIILPLLYIGVVVAAAIIGILTSVEVDRITSNLAILRESELVNANRDLTIGWILYFVGVGIMIVSMITHIWWTEAPAWLHTLLVVLAFVVTIIAVILVWVAYDNLRKVDDDASSHALWSLGLGIAGVLLALVLIFFRGAAYVREQTVNAIKETPVERPITVRKEEKEDFSLSPPYTTHVSSPGKTVTTTTRSLEGDIPEYPMLLRGEPYP